MLNLEVKEWREFIVGETFEVLNSKPYHKKDLKISSNFEKLLDSLKTSAVSKSYYALIKK